VADRKHGFESRLAILICTGALRYR